MQPETGNTYLFCEGEHGEIRFYIDNVPVSPDGDRGTDLAVPQSFPVRVPGDPNDTSKCLNGTQLAVVGNEDASKLFLIYQDSEGYLCYRSAYSFSVFRHAMVD